MVGDGVDDLVIQHVGGSVGNTVSSNPILGAMANNVNLPFTYNTSANWVHNCWTTHTSGPVAYSNVEVTFVNGINTLNSEIDAFYDFTMRCGILLNGVFYQGKVGSLTEISVSKSWGRGSFTFPTLTSIPANTTFYVTNRRVANDGGVAGSYNVITNTGGITQRQDGIISSTDNTQDFTLGVGVGYGGKNNRVTSGQVSAGGVTGVTKSAGGQNYTAALNLGPWYGPAGEGAKGATIPGSGITGYAPVSGGTYSSSVLFTPGTGHSGANPPFIFVGGVGNAGSGFGTTTAVYGPSIIMGKPASATPSVLLQGDSIMSGYGSADSTGDLNGNYGCYEQRLANGYGCFKIAVPGEAAGGWVSNNTKQLAFVDAMITRGLKISHVIIGLGVNDFLGTIGGSVLTATQGFMTSIATTWKGRGVGKIIMTTIPPYTTSSDGFVTTANQTIGNANYSLAGLVDQYNTAIKANNPVNDGVFDIRTFCQDATVTTKWRVDAFGGSTAFCLGDGIHPSMAVGIPYLTANMTIPTIS